jgi:AraC-like DNA-binding protein
MSGAPLEYMLHEADDLAAANAAMHSVRQTVSMFGADPDAPLNYVYEAHGFPGLRLAHMEIGGPMLSGVGVEDAVTVVQMTAGRMRYDYRNSGDDMQHGLVLGPSTTLPRHPGSATAITEDVEFEVATIDRELLEQTGRTVYGDDQFRVLFGHPRPVSADLARFWMNARQVTWRLVSDGAAENPMVRASLFRSMAVATLETFALLGDQERRYRTVVAQTDAYRRATRFFEDYASLPITIDDAAQAAGVSTRDLLRAFRAHAPAGVTPSGYLRRVRLDAAHADLVAGDPSRDTVRGIALRWGFPDPSAFARWYKRTHGVTPSETLRD